MDERLKFPQRWRIARSLHALGVREFDIIHPGRLDPVSIRLAREMKAAYPGIVVHAALYAHGVGFASGLERIRQAADEIDMVIPLTGLREPFSKRDKARALTAALAAARQAGTSANAGFANSSQTEMGFLLRMSRLAAAGGAAKIVLYDSIGGYTPLQTYDAVRRIRKACGLPIIYHCHNDLGLATANSLFAIYAGAHCIDATINGVGDRAGNASLEQLAILLHLQGIPTGIRLAGLKEASDLVESLTGMKRARNAPIVGDPRVIFAHVSPKHKASPRAFAAFAPELIRRRPC
jgi:homocitrate synthase NifV